MSNFFNPPTREELQERFARSRAEVATRWFGGSEEAATLMLEELPYSCIPDWGDVECLMRLLDRLDVLSTGPSDEEDA